MSESTAAVLRYEAKSGSLTGMAAHMVSHDTVLITDLTNAENNLESNVSSQIVMMRVIAYECTSSTRCKKTEKKTFSPWGPHCVIVHT